MERDLPTMAGTFRQEHNVLAENPDKGRRLHTVILNLIAQTDTDPAIAAPYKNSPS